jgi:hypothetical protein
MLKVLGPGSRLCDGITRREILQVGTLSGLGLTVPRLLAANDQASSDAPAKSVVLINLLGGPSHIDMFDMKPNAPVEVRGEFSPISSSVSGVQVCEHMPLTAQQMHLTSLIRTHTHLYNTHSPYNVVTGYSGPVIVNNVAKPTDHPSIGAVMQYAGIRSKDVPSYVWMPAHPGHSQSKHRAGPYGGFLGRQYDPFFTMYDPKFATPIAGRNAYVNPPTPVADPILPALDGLPEISLDRLDRRRSLLHQMDEARSALDRSPVARTLDGYQQTALNLLTSNKTRNAFDLSKEPAEVRNRYGRNLFGSSMLTARRLVEAGVKFIGVTTESQLDGKVGAGQWDTHSNNFKLLKNFNLPTLDQNYSALLSDLEERGLLESTLVILMGEMGRTPKVKPNNGGRDHWTQCGFILLAGGGTRRGVVHGTSDKQAGWPIDFPVSSADHVATVYRLVGIDPHLKIKDATGQTVPVALEGQPVHEVIA